MVTRRLLAPSRLPECTVLYGERYQAPEAIAERHGGGRGFGADEQCRHRDYQYCQGGKYPGVREPALGKTGTAQGEAGGTAVLYVGGHGNYLDFYGYGYWVRQGLGVRRQHWNIPVTMGG